MFNKDLFISYAHIDNQPLNPGQMGWITRFHESLEPILNMRLGSRSRIWRDDKLTGNDVFADEIVDQFADTALLVSIVSPRYLESEWCTREANEFCEKAKESGGVVIENKARVFKVVKTPVDTQETLPDVMKKVLGYDFYTFEDDVPLELDPAFGEKYAQDYNRQVFKLAWDIAQFLKRLQAPGEVPAPAKSDKPTVYLAECSYDRKQFREALEAELKLLGYNVLPDTELPRDEAAYLAKVEQLLAGCQLSIHLVGETYGAVPDGPTDKSVTILQNEIAAGRSKSHGLKRIIWVPEGIQPKEGQQEEFVESLHKSAEGQTGADLLTGDIEALKSSIHTTLKKLEEPEPEIASVAPVAGTQSKLVYVFCDEKDRKATIPLRKHLRALGLEVEIPAFEGDAAAIREAHQQMLANCDATIVFYGAGEEAWKRTIDNDLKKMAGYRSGKPMPIRYTFLADPKTSDKEELIELEEPGLIEGFGEFSEAGMSEFVKAVNPSGETR